jgi:large subunit ribosomal protein L13
VNAVLGARITAKPGLNGTHRSGRVVGEESEEVKTHTVSAGEIERKWYVVDARGKTLGRLATGIARVLRGKHKPDFSPHLDTGDHVIVINAEKIVVTGKKLDTKRYYRYSGYLGGLRSVVLREQLDKHPDRVIVHAVRGMLPKNRLGRAMLKKLKVYGGSQHPHAAQKPEPLAL